MSTPSWNQFMKRIMKELLTPPDFLHHPPSASHQSKTKSSGSSAQTSKKKVTDEEENRPLVSRKLTPQKLKKETVDSAQKNRLPVIHHSDSSGRSQTAAHQEQILQQMGMPGEVFERFQLKPYKLEQFGSVLRARTQSGIYAIKKAEMPISHIAFMDEALQYAAKNHFSKTAPFVHTRKGRPYTRIQGTSFYCTKWLHGSECDFTSHAQLGEAAVSLAQFHQATEGFEYKAYSPVPIFDLASQFRSRQQDLRRFAKLARTNEEPTAVDKWVRKNLAQYREQAKRSVEIVELPECKQQLENDQQAPGLCHLDVTSHNLIYTSKHEVALIDFDLMTFGPRVVDLAHLLRRSLQMNNWSRECAIVQLVAINGVKPLSYEEYLLIQGLLTFPLRVWRVLSGYYDGKVTEGVLGWLEQIDDQEEAKQEFLDQYATQVTHYV